MTRAEEPGSQGGQVSALPACSLGELPRSPAPGWQPLPGARERICPGAGDTELREGKVRREPNGAASSSHAAHRSVVETSA